MKFYRFIAIALLLCVVFPLVSNADSLEDANTAVQAGDYKKAFELLQPLAEQGDEEAQTRLGAMYINGQGVQDLNKGLSWVMKAATRGNGTARRIAFKVYLDLLDQGNTGDIVQSGVYVPGGVAGVEYTGIFLGDRIELSYTTKASGHRSSHTRSLNNRFGDSDNGENPTFTLIARRVE